MCALGGPVLFVAVCLLNPAGQTATPQSLTRISDPRTGIVIDFDATGAIFPDSWLVDDIGATATPMRHDQRERTRKAIQDAMGVYPADLLKSELKTVHAVGVLLIYGLLYGGTNSRDAVYLSNQGTRGFTDGVLRGTFHHELSSILLRNHPEFFDMDGWKLANPEGFDYSSDGTQALRDGRADLAYRPKYHEDGFLNEYGLANIEEDFNTFAEGMLNGHREFWKAADSYPRVEKKMRILVAFYNRLHTGFTEQSLRALASE